MKVENPNSSVIDPQAILAIKNAWKVLHVLGVSLAEVGRYWAIEGESVAQTAILQIFRIPTIRSIMDAEEELRAALEILDKEAAESIEIESEDLKYWDGPDSPNEAPVLSLVAKPPVFEDDEQ